MIYECPNCHAPQAAGRTSCHHCGAEFDGPVPDDALLPDMHAEAAAPEVAVADVSPLLPPADALPQAAETNAPQLEEVRPPAPAYQPPPYQTPAYQPAPAYAPPPAYTAAPPPSAGFPLPKALLIAIPIVLVLVLGAVFFANSLNQGGEATTPPPPVTTPAAATTPAPAPTGPPMVLPGGSLSGSGSSSESAAAHWLAGRWQNKDTDFYVFNENGTGYRGSISGKQEKASFLWVLVQNQLVLYADADKPEKLAFSQGSDDNTMYLRGPDGRYIQFARTKENA